MCDIFIKSFGKVYLKTLICVRFSDAFESNSQGLLRQNTAIHQWYDAVVVPSIAPVTIPFNVLILFIKYTESFAHGQPFCMLDFKKSF